MEAGEPKGIRFKRKKVSSLLGHTEVRFTEQSSQTDEDANPFTIIADHVGVWFRGNSFHLETVEALEVFAKAVSDAWLDHESLRKHIRAEIMGH